MNTTTKRLSVFFLGYLLFVVYGSLVPLDFRVVPFESAWQRFLDIRWLSLGAGSRADWVANILLYIPLSGVLFVLTFRSRPGSLLLSTIITLVFCMVLALTIEFSQLYFPPRTVSLNDLLAELIGTIIGIAAALFIATRDWQRVYQRGGLSYPALLLWIYVLGYLALSLFPFDFIISAAEMHAKLHSGNVGLFVAPAGCDLTYRCGIKVLLEILLAIPVGVLIAMSLGAALRHVRYIFLWALVLGAGIELLQVLLVSGITQGVSVFSRAAGAALGIGLYFRSGDIVRRLDHAKPKPLIAGLAVPYIVGLLTLHRWFDAEWVGWVDAMQKLNGVRFLPFYYHYFTTETVAMVSLLFVAGLYSPVGLGAALIQKYARRARIIPTVLSVGALVSLIEAAKLFQLGERPDPTNVPIAIASAVAAQLLAFQWLSLMRLRRTNRQLPGTASHEAGS